MGILRPKLLENFPSLYIEIIGLAGDSAGPGQNCTKIKLHEGTKLHGGTKLHEDKIARRVKFARRRF